MRISGLSQIGPEIPLSTPKGWHKSSSLSREVDDYVQHFGNSTKFCASVFSTPGCFRVHRIVCKHSLSTFLQNKTIKAGESIEKAVHCPNPTQEGGFGATLYEPNPPNRLVLAQFQRIYRSDKISSSYIDATLLKSRISWYSDCISYQIPL